MFYNGDKKYRLKEALFMSRVFDSKRIEMGDRIRTLQKRRVGS